MRELSLTVLLGLVLSKFYPVFRDCSHQFAYELKRPEIVSVHCTG